MEKKIRIKYVIIKFAVLIGYFTLCINIESFIAQKVNKTAAFIILFIVAILFVTIIDYFKSKELKKKCSTDV